MQVILLEKVHNLGSIGEEVSVRPGFGRNFLIPTGKAVPATPENVVKFEARRAELEKKAAEDLAAAKNRGEKISALKIVIRSKSGEEGKLYGSIGTRDIADAITAAGQKVMKSEVKLPAGAIRHVGDYDITLQLHSDVKIEVKVHIVAEKS